MAELDPMSAGAIVMRNYGFSLQEVADVGALLLFMSATVLHGVVSDYRISAHAGAARVETLGECEGLWEGESVLEALQKAVVGITAHTAAGFPDA